MTVRGRSCATREGASWPRIPHWAGTRSACGGGPELLFTENENNAERLWGQPNATPYVKDAFHRYVVAGDRGL